MAMAQPIRPLFFPYTSALCMCVPWGEACYEVSHCSTVDSLIDQGNIQSFRALSSFECFRDYTFVPGCPCTTITVQLHSTSGVAATQVHTYRFSQVIESP